MRLLHTSDIHLGALTGPVINGENARMMDTVRCMDFLAIHAQNEKPDAVLIAGDLFNKSKLWGEEMLKEIGIAIHWLRRLSAIAPTVLMFGTETHENPKAFENILNHAIENLYIVTKPELLRLQTKSGPLQVAAVPGFDKGYFRAKYPGMDPQEENTLCSKFLGDIILGLGTQVDPALPSVLMSHYTVVGCQLENGEHIFTQSDVVLPKEALAASPFNLVALGHIHRAQDVDGCGRPVFYSGPINGITFNEEGQDKGFWMHEIRNDIPWDGIDSKFIKTPSREFLTKQWDDQNVKTFLDYSGEDPVWLHGTQVKDKIVRIHYTCSDELNKQFNRKALEKGLYDAGAFYVSEIKPVQIITALQKQDMSENADPLTNLVAWTKREGFEEAEINALVELAKPLIAMVSANMPTGKLSGMFIPKRLEVKNYRSYLEESFEFSQISFATVNGPNGIGKSAFFMDALCDCLYEEPREGELTGWISNAEAIRSGAMTFEFGMGDTDWRVARTRAKSGKTTLALGELVKGQWEDRSCDKVKDTQDKITALLGMDAMTFRCCALIMQDAYGLFLEADKEDRMQVLANILGLNIYDQLTDLAKAKVTDHNRELTKAKEKLAELDVKLNTKAGLDAELAEVNSNLTVAAHDIAEKEAALKEAQELVRQLTAKKEKAEELRLQIEKLAGEITVKQDAKQKHQESLDKANKMLEMKAQIHTKAAEHDEVKEKITVLETKQLRLTELAAEEARIENEKDPVINNLDKVIDQVAEIEKLLANSESLQKDAEEYRSSVKRLEEIDIVAARHEEFRTEVLLIEADTDKIADKLTKNKLELDGLVKKSAMLAESNCIDPENAKCAFLADAQQAKVKVPEVEAEIERLIKEREPLDKKISNLESEQSKLNYDSQVHYDLKKRVTELRPKAEEAAQLNGKTELLATLKSQSEQLKKQRDSLSERVEKVVSEYGQLQEELKPLSELRLRLPKLAEWVKAKENLPAAVQVVETATELIATIEKEIANKEAQRKQLDSERADMLIAVTHLQGHKDDVDILTRQIKDRQGRQNELHGKAGGLKAKLEALQKDQEERNRIAEEMKPTAQLVVRYQTLSKAFGFDGIPFSIVRAVVPELSAMANEILGQMTGGKMSLEMRTDKVQKSNKKEVNALEIWITDYQRGALPYKSRSGGQKVKAALSVAFALADLKARRAGIQLGMLFIDEPPFLDGEGTEAYCDALELVSQRYPNMIVLAISHDPRMKARFPQMIDVIDTENGSKVRLVA